MSIKKLWKTSIFLKNSLEKEPVKYLTQKDFNDGTYFLDNGHYKLKENIVFHPNPNHDFLPRKDQKKYQTLGFSLGFFAVIVIASKNVLLDLNGFTISASKEFALQQRFFSIIELSDAPFIPGEGPGNFSNGIKSANNVIIRNGTLGLSSHHGIHGNNAQNVFLNNLTITNFEFVGLALNGCSNVVVKDVQIINNNQNVSIAATYSAARFVKLFSENILDRKVLPYDLVNVLKTLLGKLEKEMSITFDQVMKNQKITSDLFRNDSKLPDGNIYGVLIKNPGFAVNDFASDGPKAKNIFLYNVSVNNLRCKVDEVIGLSTKDVSGTVTDVAGAVLQIEKIQKNNKYIGNPLSDLQIFLGKIAIDLKIPLGKNNIDQDVIDWSQHKMLLNRGYKCGSDSMAHVAKGIIAFRLEGLDNVYIKNCSVSKIENHGRLGSNIKNCKPHDLAKRKGYFGANSTAINISYCSDITIRKFQCDNVVAKNGDTIGINVMFHSDCFIKKVTISNLTSGSKAKAIKSDKTSRIKTNDIVVT